jgi:hypothetical protein
VRDIVGLYLNPPDRALVGVACRREEPDAGSRSQSAAVADAPHAPGQAERRAPDYLRHGITNLFAALDFKACTVIGQFHRRHRVVEFRQFLETIDHQVPPRFAFHLIIDNYATH